MVRGPKEVGSGTRCLNEIVICSRLELRKMVNFGCQCRSFSLVSWSFGWLTSGLKTGRLSPRFTLDRLGGRRKQFGNGARASTQAVHTNVLRQRR